jgi:hypothetical protein
LSAWRELDGDFNSGDLTAQANLTGGRSVNQLIVTAGVTGSTTLSGSAVFAPGSDGVVVVPPTIPGNFTNLLPSYFQSSAPPATPPISVVASASNLPYTIQIQQVTLPNLPAVQSAVTAQDEVAGSPFLGDWLVFGGRTNGLHTFNLTDTFPPQNENETIYVINPTSGKVWSEAWSSTNVPAGELAPLYSTNQQSFQSGDTLYTVGGYGAADLGGGTFAPYTTYNTLTALKVSGMIQAVVTRGNVAALCQIQQIHDPRLKVTGGEMEPLGNLVYLTVGQDFEGEYNPINLGFTQTYTDQIRAFQINYNGQVASSLSISSFQAQDDQVNFRRRDYNLGRVVLPGGQPALEIYGGVFTPGPLSLTTSLSGFRNPILIRGIGATQVLPYQQSFSQYSAPHIDLFDPSTGSMNTILLGGISLEDAEFATGQLTAPLEDFPPLLSGLPFVNDVTTLVQPAGGSTRELEMPNQFPGLFGSEARFFANPALARSANGVINLDPLLLASSTTLGYVYGGVVSTVGLTSNPMTQTMATDAVFKITLVPNTGVATNVSLVNSLFQVLLNRLPSVIELVPYVKELNAGVPASQVALSIINLPEHRARELTTFYNEFLGTTIGAADELKYLTEYAHGATDQQVIAQILDSPAFHQTKTVIGLTGNSVLVEVLYADLLDRRPTSSEEVFWVLLLNTGTPLSTLINTLLTSTEYLQNQVSAFYTLYLGVPPSPDQVAQGVAALQQESSEQYLASLLATPQYFAAHPGVPGQSAPIPLGKGSGQTSASPLAGPTGSGKGAGHTRTIAGKGKP